MTTPEPAAVGNDGFRILFSSPEFVVVDKPHDVAMDGERDDLTVEKWVHTALAEFMAEPLPENASIVPGGGKPMMRDKSLKFVHQLDYATSGVLCLAFSKDCASAVAHCFEMRQTAKEYYALVHGWVPDTKFNLEVAQGEDAPPLPSMTRSVVCSFRRHLKEVSLSPAPQSLGAVAVDESIVNDETDDTGFRMRLANASDVKPPDALTVISVMKRGYVKGFVKSSSGDDVHQQAVPCTLVHLRLFTGRRHQLRLHCMAIGHPIIGDVAYQGAEIAAAGVSFPRMMLHAQKLRMSLDVVSFMQRSAKERAVEKRLRRKTTINGPLENVADGDAGSVFEAENRLLEYFHEAV